MLKTTSTGIAASTLGNSLVASRSMTSCPAAEIASRTAWMVEGASYSASSSRRPLISGLMRFTLKVNPTRSGPALRSGLPCRRLGSVIPQRAIALSMTFSMTASVCSPSSAAAA